MKKRTEKPENKKDFRLIHKIFTAVFVCWNLNAFIFNIYKRNIKQYTQIHTETVLKRLREYVTIFDLTFYCYVWRLQKKRDYIVITTKLNLMKREKIIFSFWFTIMLRKKLNERMQFSSIYISHTSWITLSCICHSHYSYTTHNQFPEIHLN